MIENCGAETAGDRFSTGKMCGNRRFGDLPDMRVFFERMPN